MFYFVRHGQTNHNVGADILSGYMEVELNENGIAQAKETALKLKDVHFDICYCSTSIRAKQTLNEILAYHKGLKVIYDKRLRERDYGEITGMHASVCKFRRWHADDPIPFKGMESIPEMFDRVASFFDEIIPISQNKNVLVVGHSGSARMTYYYFNGKPKDNDYRAFKLENAEVLMLNEKKE